MLKIDRSIAPAVRSIERLNLTEPKIYKLDNELSVFAFRSDLQPVIKIHILTEAGKYYQEKPLQAYLTSKMLYEGSQQKPSEAFADALDFYGANFKSSSGMDVAGITLSFLKKHTHEVLPLLAELIEQPAFRAEDFDVIRNNEKQRFLVDKNKNDFVADRHFNQLIFGKAHPYGKMYEEADFDNLSVEDIQNHFKSHCDWSKAKILVAGDFDDELIDELNKIFGHFKSGTKGTLSITRENYKPTKERFSLKDAKQAAIRIGCRSIDRTNPDFSKFSFVNTLFGAHFSSRLMNNIREDKGYTYGIYSTISNYRNNSSFEISTEVGIDVTNAALKEIYYEMNRLCEEPVSNEEMLLVKNYLLGRLLSGLDGVFKQAAYYKMLLIFGLNYGYIYNLIDAIQSITKEEVQEIASEYLQKSYMTELVVE